MRFVKLSFRILGFLIALAVLLPLVAISALQVPAGRAFVSGLAGSLASTPGQRITLEDLHIDFGLDAGFGRLTLADRDGTWLSVENARLEWQPLALLGGDLDITSLAASRIDLPRLARPAPDTSASAPPADDETSGGIGLPVNIDLQRLDFGEINLGADLVGEPISLSAEGSGAFALDPALVTADLDVNRIDGIEAGLSAQARFEPASETLKFDITVSEPRGGLAARLLDVAELPALDLALRGDGPLTDWNATLELALDGRRTVTGSAAIAQIDRGRRLTFDLDGDLAPLAPPAAQAFFAGTTDASGSAEFTPSFAPLGGTVSLRTETVTLNANAALAGETMEASADLTVGAGPGTLIALDIDQRRIAFGEASANLRVNGNRTAADWSARVDLASFRTTEARTGAVRLEASGTKADLSPDRLASPIDLRASIAAFEGLVPAAGALDGDMTLAAQGHLDGAARRVNFSAAEIRTAAGEMSLGETTASAERVAAKGRIRLPDLASFSVPAGRDLGGSLTGSFDADVDLASLSGPVSASLNARDLSVGTEQADALLAGETRADVSLRLAGAEDITIEGLHLENDRLSVTGDGRYRPDDLTSQVELSLRDLSRLDPQLSGALDASVQTSGPPAAISLTASAGSERILLAGTPLENLSLDVSALADPDAPSAQITSSASLNGQPLDVDVDLTSENGGARISPLTVRLAGNTVTGALAVTDLDRPVETLEGKLDIKAPDLATLSPLLLTEISGALEGTVTADPNARRVVIDLTGADLAVPAISIGQASVTATLAAPFAPETIGADIEVTDILTDATPVRRVTLQASPRDGGTALDGEIALDKDGTDGLTLKALLTGEDADAWRLALSDLALRYQGLTSRLKQPVDITYQGGVAVIEPLELQLGNGSLALAGKAGENLDLKADLSAVPLDLANAFAPSLGLGGTLSGTVTATGSASAPAASWTVTGSGLTAAQLRSNGLSALGLTSNGSLKDNQVSQTTRVNDPNGLDLTISGTAGAAAPHALSLNLKGTVPTAVIRRPMLEAGLRAEGGVAVSGSVSGTAAAPVWQVSATPAGLRITSLSTGLTVQNISGSASADPSRVSINGISGELATGGAITASGSVGLGDGFPADLSIRLDEGRYVDPGLVTAEVDADLTLSGPLASTSAAAVIEGKITINKADVSIPETLPGAIAPVEVRHVNASKAVREQVAELGGESGRSQTQQKSFPPRLDILLSAPGRIFVRGRGLDAELQGDLKIVGTTAAPRAIGAFNLKRGQLDILTRRLVFSRGDATFEGTLTPILDFAAATAVADTTITVTVNGLADDPQIGFTSAPELPQDEVLARLLFGKSVGNLSPTQIARLAAAIATLTGGSDNGPLATIRKSLGLDAVDINTDGENGPSVAVGKYINDNIYVGVEQGTGSGSSRVKVDIDLDRGLKVRGEVGADGSSKAGIFFEKEY